MADIPRVPAGANLVSPNWLDNHSTRNYLSEAAVYDTLNFRGDICKYLSDRRFSPPGHWRMPNGKELGHLTSEYSTSELSATLPATVLISGMTDFYNGLPSSYVTKYVSSTTFPAGGSREATTTGAFSPVTYYLSGSPTNNSGNPSILNACYSLRITTPPAIAYTTAQIGAPGIQGLVRCVKLDEEGLPRTFLDLFLTGDIEDWTSEGIYGTDTQGEIWY